MIEGAGDFIKWASALGYKPGGGGSGGVTAAQVQQNAFNFAAGLGADDAFVVNLSPAVTTLTNGLPIYMVSAFTNLTTTPTLKINALPTKPIVSTSGEALIVDDIQANAAYLFIYSAADDNFQLINPSISNANAYLVQKNYFNFAPDIGVADAYEANLPVRPLAISDGLSVILQADNTNTGASTLTLNGYPAIPIVGISGGALIAGEIIGGSMASLIYSANYEAFILLNPAIIPGTGTVGAGSINDLAYYASSGTTISSLATANNGVLVTDNTGVPSLLPNGTEGYILTANASAAPSWQQNGYLNNSVLLAPNSDQTISGGFGLIVSGSGNIQAATITAGFNGTAGYLAITPPTTDKGALQIAAADNAAQYEGLLINASLNDNRTWTLPDASGTLALASDASGIVNSGLANQLTYYATSGNAVSGLSTANNGLLVTDGSGVPSIGNSIGADIVVNGVTIGQGNYKDINATNTALGAAALSSNVSGTNNTGVGASALSGITSGSNNAAFGFGALLATADTNDNLALGVFAGYQNNGGQNVLIGFSSGFGLGSVGNGSSNVLIGSSTGLANNNPGSFDLNAGNNNTWIGGQVSGNNENISGSIGIGCMAFPSASNGNTSANEGPGIAIGSSAYPVGFRGDGSAYPAGNANYWRTRVNDVFYKIPILPDSTDIQWPLSGTLATTDAIVSSATGTENQVLVNGFFDSAQTGDVVLSLPQDIGTTSSPTFTGLHLSGDVSGVVNFVSNTSEPILNFAYQPDAVNYLEFYNSPDGIDLSMAAAGTTTDIGIGFQAKGQGIFSYYTNSSDLCLQILSGVSGQHISNLNFPSTNNSIDITFQDASGTVAYLSDITGAGVTSLEGTANQVLVNGTSGSAQTGVLTLTLPQDIATSSSPSFTNLTLDGQIVGASRLCDTDNAPVIDFTYQTGATNYFKMQNAVGGNAPRFQVTGTDANVSLTLQTQSQGSLNLLTEATGAAIKVFSGTSSVHQTNLNFPSTANTVDVTFQDVTGTVALLSDIPAPQTWINATASPVVLVPGTWYICNDVEGQNQFILPATAALGVEFRIKGGPLGSGWSILQNDGQQIQVGNRTTTAGTSGYVASTADTDYISITCVSENTLFGDTGFTGNILVS